MNTAQARRVIEALGNALYSPQGELFCVQNGDAPARASWRSARTHERISRPFFGVDKDQALRKLMVHMLFEALERLALSRGLREERIELVDAFEKMDLADILGDEETFVEALDELRRLQK